MGNQPEKSVYQLSNGMWGFRYCVRINGKNVCRRSSKDKDGNPLKTKRDALRARKQAISCVQNPPEPVKTDEIIKRTTVSAVFEEYREKGRADRAYNTKLKQDSLWKNHLKAEFGNRFVDEIKTTDIQDYLTRLYYEDGFAYRYVESFLKMFYLIFGQAYSRGYLPLDLYNRLCKNKDTKIHMPKMKTDEDLDIVAFSNEECAKLDAYFHGTNAETAYMLGRYCGLRINECYGLKWNQIDLENGVIHIEQQQQYQKGIIRLVPLKTRNARRTIYLNQRMKDYLSALISQWNDVSPLILAQREQNQKFIEDTNGKKVSCLELVNCLYNGKIQTVNSMKYHSRTLKDKYDIFFKYHYLRHPYVKHTTKIFSLRLMNFQAQAYPDARRKTRGACQLHRGGQSQSPVRPLCNRERFSCLPPQSKISWILYATSMRLSGYTSTLSISSSASSVVSVSVSKIALDASLRLSCRACSSCFCFACANTAA